MKNLNKTDIGLIGLAVMGENLALNMADKGWNISVYNRTVPGVEEGENGAAEKIRENRHRKGRSGRSEKSEGSRQDHDGGGSSGRRGRDFCENDKSGGKESAARGQSCSGRE